jgi:aminopeptidase N
MAEYDYEGWHTDPYIAREFYGVWGDFDVTIHIDEKHMLGGTGYIQNPQEVGFGYENKNKILRVPNTPKLKWHFKAPNVHDFTWVADANFVHDTKKLNNGTILHFLYKEDAKIQKNWRKMQPIAVKTMEFYNKYVGEYAYDQYSIIQGGDGGMEYAMCTLVTAHRSFEGLVGTMMHEMGHAWFQFALATNESKHEWMDEGFTTYIEAIASDKIVHNKGAFIFENSYNYYYYMVNTGLEEPLTTHADRYQTNMSYGINAYDKGLVFIAQLGYIIGEESLEKSIKKYYKMWAGKHPNPTDFIRVAEITSGINLDWYLNEFTQTTHTIEYGIDKVEAKKITLIRKGRIPMPIDLEVTYMDGTKESFYIPLNLMRGEKQTDNILLPDWNWGHQTYSFDVSKEVKEVRIDTSLLMADINKNNNKWVK